MFLRSSKIFFGLRGDAQLGFKQVEIYSGSENVALTSKVTVQDLLPGSNPQSMINGKGDLDTLTKKMLNPKITIDLNKVYEITRIVLIFPENLKVESLNIFIVTNTGVDYSVFPGVLPQKYEFVPLLYVAKERQKYLITREEFERIVNDRRVEWREVRGLADFVSRGSATNEELFKIAPFFIDPRKVLLNIPSNIQKQLCLTYPDYQFCNICEYNSNDSTCKEINSKFCKGSYGTDQFCEKYAVHNKLYLDAKPYCTKLDNLLHTPLCRELFPKNSDCPGDGCSISKNLYEDACKNSKDSRCGCINHEMLQKNREKALHEQLNIPLEKTTKSIEDQIKVYEKLGEKEKALKLKQMLPKALDKIKEYYYFVAYGLTPVPPTCLIKSCQDGSYPVTQKCSLTTFVLAMCFNTIDITALLGGSIRFQGTQQCNQTINLGKCSSNDCPKGYKCLNGECKAECIDGKCPQGYKCDNGYCSKGDEEIPLPTNNWIIWLIAIFIIIILLIIVIIF